MLRLIWKVVHANCCISPDGELIQCRCIWRYRASSVGDNFLLAMFMLEAAFSVIRLLSDVQHGLPYGEAINIVAAFSCSSVNIEVLPRAANSWRFSASFLNTRMPLLSQFHKTTNSVTARKAIHWKYNIFVLEGLKHCILHELIHTRPSHSFHST